MRTNTIVVLILHLSSLKKRAMPIEIRELVIKAVVDSEKDKAGKKKKKEIASKKNVFDGLEKLLDLIENKNER